MLETTVRGSVVVVVSVPAVVRAMLEMTGTAGDCSLLRFFFLRDEGVDEVVVEVIRLEPDVGVLAVLTPVVRGSSRLGEKSRNSFPEALAAKLTSDNLAAMRSAVSEDFCLTREFDFIFSSASNEFLAGFPSRGEI